MLSELPKEVPLTKIEALILGARQEGLSFCQLQGNDLRYATDQIMVRGAAITGCELPGTEYFADMLSNELVEFISNYGYGEYTLKEILTALRLNTQPGMRWPSGLEIERIAFTGSCFNVDFLARVLGTYSQLRNILDRKFQNFIDGY